MKKHTPLYWRFNWLFTLLWLSLLSVSLPATASQLSFDFKPHTVHYQVRFNSKTLGSSIIGKVATIMQQTADGFSVTSTAKAQGLGALFFGSSLQESCQFKMQQHRAVATACTGGTIKKQKYAVDYTWQNRQLTFNDNSALDMPTGYVMNITMMPFATAALASLQQNADLKNADLSSEVLYVVDGKNQRIRGFKHRSSETEQLQTKIGTLDTVKVVFERELRPERTLTLWLSPSHDYVPVQMQESRKSRVTTLNVLSIEMAS